jgi:hypothetical protein
VEHLTAGASFNGPGLSTYLPSLYKGGLVAHFKHKEEDGNYDTNKFSFC